MEWLPNWEEDFGQPKYTWKWVTTYTSKFADILGQPEIAASKEFTLADNEFLKQCGIMEISLDKP